MGQVRGQGAAPAARALPADIVPAERLPKLVARYAIASQTAFIVGPVMGCFLYAVNVSLPMSAIELLVLTMHETYPGHHAERCAKEHRLVRGQGLLEETLVLVPAVMQLLGDGNWWMPKWLDRLLLRLWPDAEVVRPPELRDRVRSLAARTRDRYRDARA